MSNTAINPSPGSVGLTGYAPLVMQSYSTAPLPPLASTLLSRFPSQSVSVLNPNGTFTNEWYRALRLVRDILTDGVNAIPVADIITAINDSRSNVLGLSNFAVGLEKQTKQNAEASAAVIAVVKTAALPGAEAIPPVQQVIEPSGGGE